MRGDKKQRNGLIRFCSFKLLYPLCGNITWSKTSIPISFPASFSRLVRPNPPLTLKAPAGVIMDKDKTAAQFLDGGSKTFLG